MSGVLFEDIFEVGKLNPDGKKFDRGEGESLRRDQQQREFETNLLGRGAGVVAYSPPRVCIPSWLMGDGVAR